MFVLHYFSHHLLCLGNPFILTCSFSVDSDLFVVSSVRDSTDISKARASTCFSTTIVGSQGVLVYPCTESKPEDTAFFSPRVRFDSAVGIDTYPSMQKSLPKFLGLFIGSWTVNQVFGLACVILLYTASRCGPECSCILGGTGGSCFCSLIYIVALVVALIFDIAVLSQAGSEIPDSFSKDVAYCLERKGYLNQSTVNISAIPLESWDICFDCLSPGQNVYTQQELKESDFGPCTSFSGSITEGKTSLEWGPGTELTLRYVMLGFRVIIFLFCVYLLRAALATFNSETEDGDNAISPTYNDTSYIEPSYFDTRAPTYVTTPVSDDLPAPPYEDLPAPPYEETRTQYSNHKNSPY